MIKTANVDRHKFIQGYLALIQGFLQLSSAEYKLVFSLIDRYLIMKTKGLQEPYLSKLLFSSDTMSEIREEHSWSSQMLSNTKSTLTKKRLIVNNQLAASVIPQEEITFKFIVDYEHP